MAIRAEDVARGREAMTYFHNASVGKSGYNHSLDSLISTVAGKNKDFLDALGFSANTLIQDGTLTVNSMRSSMESLAAKSAGRLPTQQSFIQALGNTASNPSFLAAVTYTATETAKTVSKGAQEVGKAVIDTGAIVTRFLPYIVVIGVLGYLYVKVKRA